MPATSSRAKHADINQHELIDTPIGRIERWRADAVLTGETSAAQEYMKQFRQQFAQLRADSIDFREAMEEWAKDLTAREEALTGERRPLLISLAARPSSMNGLKVCSRS